MYRSILSGAAVLSLRSRRMRPCRPASAPFGCVSARKTAETPLRVPTLEFTFRIAAWCATAEVAAKCQPGDENWAPVEPAALAAERDRQPWEVWEATGSQTPTDCVWAELKKILTPRQPHSLPDGAAEKTEAILWEAEARDPDRREWVKSQTSNAGQLRADRHLRTAPGSAVRIYPIPSGEWRRVAA
jgi:hypothetical protein